MWPLLLLLSLAQDQPTFRSDVSLVHVDAEVRQGVRVAGDLTKEDFHLTDSAKPQAIEYFAHEDQPLDVVLLFDTRDEMRTAVERVAAVAQTAFSDFRPQDRVAVMSFDCKPNLIADFTASTPPRSSSSPNRPRSAAAPSSRSPTTKAPPHAPQPPAPLSSTCGRPTP